LALRRERRSFRKLKKRKEKIEGIFYGYARELDEKFSYSLQKPRKGQNQINNITQQKKMTDFLLRFCAEKAKMPSKAKEKAVKLFFSLVEKLKTGEDGQFIHVERIRLIPEEENAIKEIGEKNFKEIEDVFFKVGNLFEIIPPLSSGNHAIWWSREHGTKLINLAKKVFHK